MRFKYIYKPTFDKEQHTNMGGNNAIFASSNCFIGNGNDVKFAGDSTVNQQTLTERISELMNELTTVENQLSAGDLELIRELLSLIKASPEQVKGEQISLRFVTKALEPFSHIATIWQSIMELIK
jgi:hypothetical protein